MNPRSQAFLFLRHLKHNGVLRYISWIDINRGIMSLNSSDDFIRVTYFYTEGNLVVWVKQPKDEHRFRNCFEWVPWSEYSGSRWSSVLHKGDIVSGVYVGLYLLACCSVAINRVSILIPTFGENGSVEAQNYEKYKEAVKEGWCRPWNKKWVDKSHQRRMNRIQLKVERNQNAALIHVSGLRWVTPDYRFIVTRDKKTETYTLHNCKNVPGHLPKAAKGVLASRKLLPSFGEGPSDCARVLIDSFLRDQEKSKLVVDSVV